MLNQIFATIEAASQALKDGPVGTCPLCGDRVYNALESDGPVWICPSDLDESNVFHVASDVTEAQKEADGDYSNCPSFHNLDEGFCDYYTHMPMHSSCYDKLFTTQPVGE